MDKINAEVFITVAKCGSYRKAAEKLGYTQAGISYIIKNMEEQAGIDFFIREFGGVRLTPEGDAILPYMHNLYQYEETVKTKIDELKGLITGHIRLISFTTILVCWMPQILKGFKEKYPGITIEVTSCEGPSQGVNMIYENEADCGFLATDISDKIKIINLGYSEDMAIVSLDHEKANAEIFTHEDMQKYPLIGYPEEEAPYVYKMAREHNIKFNQTMTVNNDYGNLCMISQNMGYGIYPKMTAENCVFPVKAIPIENGTKTPFSLGIKEDNASLAAKAFIDYVLSLDLT